MIDICLFGREISDLVRVSSGDEPAFFLSYFHQSRGDYFIRPVVVVVEGDARVGLRRDDC